MTTSSCSLIAPSALKINLYPWSLTLSIRILWMLLFPLYYLCISAQALLLLLPFLIIFKYPNSLQPFNLFNCDYTSLYYSWPWTLHLMSLLMLHSDFLGSYLCMLISHLWLGYIFRLYSYYLLYCFFILLVIIAIP